MSDPMHLIENALTAYEKANKEVNNIGKSDIYSQEWWEKMTKIYNKAEEEFCDSYPSKMIAERLNINIHIIWEMAGYIINDFQNDHCLTCPYKIDFEK